MYWIGLTGGIGAGKSTVARLLAAHGAAVVDADVLAREAVAPGSEGLAEVVAAFGSDFSADFSSAVFAAVCPAAPWALPPIDSISISESRLRWPVCLL